MNIDQAKQEEVDARMAMVRGYQNQFLSDEDRERLAQAHRYAKFRVRIARVLAEGPKLTMKQKVEIASML